MTTSDPVSQAFLNTPIDDEPLTPEEIQAIEEGEAEFARGEFSTWDGETESKEERALVQEAYEAIARGEVVSEEDLDRELGW